MGMPCQVNSILKLNRATDYPPQLVVGQVYTASKSGYRILPMDVPLQLVDEAWLAHADIIIRQLVWADQQTTLTFVVDRIYPTPFSVKQLT
jgi:Protein of unknown function (DUF2584)